MTEFNPYSRRFVKALGLLSLLTVALLAIRILVTGSWRYWFIPENLLLAWLPLVLSWLLLKRLKKTRWLTWRNLLLTFLWLVFLPNSWYVLTDFVHVYPTGEISHFYDIALMTMLVSCGFILGFASLYMVHRRLIKPFGLRTSHILVGVIILISSFAIYMGRDLRWNSWDLVASPGELIFDISDRIIDPFGHPRAVSLTGLLFVVLATQYTALWLVVAPPPTSRRA